MYLYNVSEHEICSEYFENGSKANGSKCTEFPLLMNFNNWYKEIHGYLSAILCICGVITNILNSIVLTKKSMMNPINLILLGIALSDMLKMLSYSIYTIYLNLITYPFPCDYPHTYSWICFILLHSSIIICTHTTSTLLIVALASFRAWTLTNMTVESRLHRKHSYLSIVSLFTISLLFALPSFFMQEVIVYKSLENIKFHWFTDKTGFYTEWKIQFVLYGCIVKTLSTVVLVILTTYIIVVMKNSSKVKRRLNEMNKHTDTGVKSMVPLRGSRHQHSVRDPYHKASMLLVTVVICFVLTELPQGIINTTAALAPCFMDQVYIHIGDIMDLLVLINSSINFILYCVMSKQFRDTFTDLFCHFCKQSTSSIN